MTVTISSLTTASAEAVPVYDWGVVLQAAHQRRAAERRRRFRFVLRRLVSAETMVVAAHILMLASAASVLGALIVRNSHWQAMLTAVIYLAALVITVGGVAFAARCTISSRRAGDA
jgi:hypothetical protein